MNLSSVPRKVATSFEVERFIVYDASARVIAEYSTVLSEVPRVNYATVDRLSTPRIHSAESGKVTSRHDFMPFGELIHSSERSLALSYRQSNIRRSFTTYSRDAETSSDFA